ncbi:MAG: hypothetical protein K2I03_13625 [Lachnospiraceae bacterium]|nr:hypothetical protein [Lachnospiraceae bacterium]
MKKRKRKSLIVILPLFVVLGSIHIITSLNDGYAIEETEQKADMQSVKDFSTFTKNKSDYQNIEKKIDMESQNDIFGDKYHDAEKFLNDAGIFDEELELHFTENKLDELEDIGLENISIMSAYYVVDESVIQKNSNIGRESIDAAQMFQLNEQQVDEYFAEKYFERKTDIYKKVSILKKTIMVYEADMGYARLQAWFDWSDMPSERDLDFVKIRIEYGQYERDASGDYGQVTAKHQYYKLVKDGAVGTEVEKKKVSFDIVDSLAVDLKDGEYNALDHMFKAAVDLGDNKNELKSDGNVYSEEIIGESVFIDYYVRLISANADVDYLEVEPLYIHVME